MATDFREMDWSSFQEDTLKASLHWLSMQLSKKTQQQSIALLLDPVEEQHWRQQLIVQLTAPPVIYCAVVNSFLSITPTEEDSFQYLFQTLARKGVFLDDCDDMIITEAILATQHPFSTLAHQTMINALMKLYVLTHISIHSVISEVKRVAYFTPSKELPSSSNEALLLWVIKISNYNIHKMKGLKGVKDFCSHFASDKILEVVRDGQSLAALLHFYLPGFVKWNDIYFSSSLSEDKSMHNLMMVKTTISSNTPVKCHFDPHLLLLSSHVMLNPTVTMALEHNVFVFLSSLFLHFKHYVTEQPVKQLSNSCNGDSPTGTKPMTANKLTKRKDLQKGVLPITKPPSGYFPVCNSREGLTHTVSDSSLCAHRVDTSSSASSISLIDFTKNPSGRSKCTVAANKSTNKQKITASSESLNMVQFEMHTSLRIKRPPSGQTTKECFVSKTAKSVSFQDDNFTDKSIALPANTSENGFSDHEQDRNTSVVSCSHGSNQQSQSVAIITDQSSYRWLVKTLSSHGVTLEGNDSVPDNQQQVIPVNEQDVPMLIPCKVHAIDNAEDEHSTVSRNHQIISCSKESVRVDNIAMLKFKQLTVDSKLSHCNSSHNTVPVITSKTISPEDNHNSSSAGCESKSSEDSQSKSSEDSQNKSSEDNQNKLPEDSRNKSNKSPGDSQNKSSEDSQNKSLEDSQNRSPEDSQNRSPVSCEDNQSKSHGELDKSISSLDEESEDKTMSQSSPVTTYTATDEDMKIIAAACYEYVMDMLENWDSLPVDDDIQPYEEDNVVYYIDNLDPPAKKPPASDANNEDMQCLAMACYETVMEMIRNGDVYSEDDIHMIDNNPIYYLDVEPSHSYELPLYNPPSPPQHPPSHVEKKSPPAEVSACKTVSQQTYSQTLVTEEDTILQCCIGSVDSLVPCSEQRESEQVEDIINGENATRVLKDDSYSFNELGQDDNNPAFNHPFATFIDISDAKKSQEHVKKLESRRQKIKMQLMERDKTRIKKRNTPHKPKDSISPQCLHATERDSEKQLQTTTIIKKSTATSQEGHVLHFTLGSQEPSQPADNPLIVNIPNVAMTTALPTPPRLTGTAAATNAPLDKVTADQPVPIPYSGPQCYVQPPIKSNRKIICNAISHTCLAGAVNNKARLEAIRIIEDSPEKHFLVLFRDDVGRKFRAIYSFDDKKVHKLYGAGPKLITNSMVSRVYKYNSGSREFNPLPSINISMSADAFTMHNFIWAVAKNKKHMH